VTPPSHEEVASGDERAIRAHEERTNVSHFVWRTGTAHGTELDHPPACTTRSVFCFTTDTFHLYEEAPRQAAV
jgi:hypothetical protein